jgi:ribosomal protein L17
MKHTQKTMDKIEQAITEGAEIIENANARYTGKRAGYTRVVRLAQTNSCSHGWPINVVWACYR